MNDSIYENAAAARYLEDLRHRLRRLNPAERSEAMRYHEEYLTDRLEQIHEGLSRQTQPAPGSSSGFNGASSLDPTASLPSPKEVAAGILAQSALREAAKHPTAKNSLRVTGFVLLAVFAVPLAAPLAIALAAVAISVAVTFFALIVSVLATLAGLAVTGAAVGLIGIVESVYNLFCGELMRASFLAGFSIASAGLGILFGILTVLLGRAAIEVTIRVFRRLFNRSQACQGKPLEAGMAERQKAPSGRILKRLALIGLAAVLAGGLVALAAALGSGAFILDWLRVNISF
jgi:uncharacterized membrane protein